MSRGNRVKIGEKQGRLTVTGPIKDGKYLAKCICGTERYFNWGYVRRAAAKGGSPSCGCFKIEQLKSNPGKNLKHGLGTHPIYDVHRQMHQRCYNSKHRAFPDYGGRGIKVCERWQDLTTFWEDVKSIYVDGHQIDRVDNNGNYEPGNVRFVSVEVNANNKRNNRLLQTPDGPMNLSQAGRFYGLRPETIHYRLGNGWSMKEACLTPSKGRKRGH